MKKLHGITDDPSLYYENGSAAGHTWNGKEYKYKATDATCTKNETYYVYCSVCEEAVNHDETFEKPDTKLSHEWEETKTYPQSAADCDSAATYYKECKNCHESSKDHDGSTWVYGEALGHDFSSQIKDVAHRKNKANCVAPATYYYDCSRCDVNAKLLTDGTADDWTYTDGEVDPKNHTDLVLVPFKAADCTEAGHNAHKKCEGCKVEIGKVVYDALGHDFTGEYVPVTPTTHKRACANDGCTAYSDVENCSFESSEWKQIEGTDTHKRECVCGNSEVGDCEGGKSTCTEKATCTICGGKYGTTTDHKYADKWTSDGEGTNTHSKACLNDGCTAKKTEKCSGGNAATCSQKSICSECNTAYGSLADHSFVNYVTTKAPTCYTNEEKTATCEFNCGTTDTVVIPNSNLTHDMSDGYVVTKEPTCKEEGIQTNTCKHGCGHSVTQTIPAVKDAHISSDWIKEDASADCSTGIRYYKECTVCGDILETKTEEGQHEWDAVVTVKPTCITDGYINYVCTNCGFTKTENPEELKANGEHTWGEMIVTKAATCSNKGRGYYECELCGAQSEAKEIDKLDHTSRRYVDPVAPTCEKKGHNGYWNCLDCSYSSRESDEYVEYPALGHNDKNNDGTCDDCKFVIYDKDGDNDIDGSCGCICHNDSWFGQLIYKICNFFWKLFKMKPSCNCGHKHY